jgi:co-chaperonin GroES (HSP10)
MQSRLTPIIMASATLLFISSCEQKTSNGDTQSSGNPEKTEEPFVIAPRLVNNDGSFELLAVIDGAEANKQFVKNLDIVRAQKVILKKLNDETEKTDETKQKIADVEKKLQENTDLMAKIYAYKADSDYLFIPVRSALVKVVDDKKELIKKIESPKTHHELQGMRAKYAELSKKDGESSTEVQALAAELLKEFNYDVKLKYEIEIGKGVLYRKVN